MDHTVYVLEDGVHIALVTGNLLIGLCALQFIFLALTRFGCEKICGARSEDSGRDAYARDAFVPSGRCSSGAVFKGLTLGSHGVELQDPVS